MHILIVEDEFLISLAASEDLTRAGHHVACAFDADQAIDLLETNPDIELIFTDIDLPGSMDGLNLAAAVHDRWPPMKIIVTSGKRPPMTQELPLGGYFLPKPYLGSELVDAVARLN